ncbi:MAG: DAK2 domain-containing protein [Candidatus Izemoplasmatales bacterium]|nr:DAK2 domain-containing protein [Candidatus Izemoplasmatales bacterium]
MDTLVLNGNLLRQLVTNGSINLRNNMDRINELNVFPVPDGDTGSNMSATMSAGAKAISTVDEPSIGAMAKILSRGMLMGARGNSGVILSQLFSGLANGLKGKDTVNMVEFSQALRQGVEQAYAAVINPVEGTILTVAREGADRAISVSEDVKNFEDFFKIYLKELYASLERTPELLPILKEVGVIDSGGAGYIEIVVGMADYLEGILYENQKEESNNKVVSSVNMEHFQGDIDFGYCTEFIMQIEKMDEFNQKDFIEMISPLGDSLVCVQDENILKIHIHTKTPGDALNLAQHFGFFINIKIENMTVQHTEVLMHQPQLDGEACGCGHDHTKGSAPKIKKKYALVAVVNGDGLKDTFIEMGCDYIVEGGQTMNPSIEDFVKACEAINSDFIIIIPNNKNVLLSAETAAKMVEDKNVYVLPAKTIAQGYAALTMFDATQDVETNLKDMNNHIENVKTGEVTYAIRQSVNNGTQINKDDYMGIFDGQIKVSTPSRIETTKTLVRAMIDSRSEIITLMVGNDVQKTEVKELTDMIDEDFSVEVEVIYGGQDIYSYIISVE